MLELKGQENKQTTLKEPFSYGALENSASKTEHGLAQTSLSAVKGRWLMDLGAVTGTDSGEGHLEHTWQTETSKQGQGSKKQTMPHWLCSHFRWEARTLRKEHKTGV